MKAPSFVAALFVSAFVSMSPLAAQDGSDINQAIPIYFGQVITDIVDAQLKPLQTYSITLAQGQRITAVATTSPMGTNQSWCVSLWSPSTATVKSRSCDRGSLAYDAYNNTARTMTYQVPAGGKYYLVVSTDRPQTDFKLQVTAEGTPILVPNPTSAGCVSGRVDYLTYSLQLIAAGLADEVSIGGQKLCASCPVKAPRYPEIVNRLENALRSKVNVEACYDSAGSIFQIKLVQP